MVKEKLKSNSSYIVLFQKESKLIKSLKDLEYSVSGNEFDGFSKEDIEFYENYRHTFHLLQFDMTYVPPYYIDCNELIECVDEISSRSLETGYEHGSLMLLRLPPCKRRVFGLPQYKGRKIKRIHFSEIIEGRESSLNPRKMIKQNKNKHNGILGVLHSHPENDYPSPNDFASKDFYFPLTGVILPKEKRLIFYKIKTPLFYDSKKAFTSVLFWFVPEKKREIIDEYCIKEEISLQ
ncbi:MAG: hypothetical protein ACE5J7_04765 [Candidatus Aenigmatarchaeota archaeon]